MKKLLKFLLGAALLLVVVSGAVFFWLRFEFERATSDEGLAAWDQVTVKSLGDSTASAATCARQYPDKKAWFGDFHVHTAASYDATSFDVTTSAE